jgi:hypothetical protein
MKSHKKLQKFFTPWWKLGILVLALILCIVLYTQFFTKETPKEQAKRAQQVVETFLDVPRETPQIVVVRDVEKIRAGQPLFTKAANDDLILEYSDRVIVFRPSTNKIISMGVPEPSTPTTTLNPDTMMQSVKVEVRNGTKKTGLAKKVVDILKKDFANNTYNPVGTSPLGNYTGTVIYVATPGAEQAAQDIATRVGATFITQLKDGEKATEQDVLVILGPNVDNLQ